MKLVRGSVFCFRNVILGFCTYPLPRIQAIVLRPGIRSPCESNFPRAPRIAGVRSRGQLAFVIVTPSVVSATKGVELMSLASMARVSRSVSSLMGMSKWNLDPSSADGVSIALMWHSTDP